MGVNDVTPSAMKREPIDTTNDYLLSAGENLPNHSMSKAGLGKYVTQSLHEIPIWRTRQDAYRYAAYLVTLAETLPDTEGEEGVTLEHVIASVQNA